MVRKLLCMVALIGLVLLVQAAPGLADIYNLSNLGDLSYTGDLNHSTWTETRGGQSVGFAPSTFKAYSSPDGSEWNIPLLKIDASKSEYSPDYNYWQVIKTTYNTLNDGSSGTPLFTANLAGGTVITSYDTVITLTATYQKENPWDQYPSNSKEYLIYGGDGQRPTFTMEGSGTSDGTPFTFSATLVERITDHTHDGYFSDFSVNYTAAAQTPIPGAVWLLGTGLLGLVCVGRRRRA
jgi:hypothetical protein